MLMTKVLTLRSLLFR